MSKVSRSPMRSLFVVPAVLMLAAAPAMAQSSDDTTITVNHAAKTTTRTVGVQVAGLNLADGHDYARLQGRVSEAADKVCADEGLWNRDTDRDYNQCRKAAIAGAMSQAVASAGGGAN